MTKTIDAMKQLLAAMANTDFTCRLGEETDAVERAIAAEEAQMTKPTRLDAEYFYNLVMHALMYVDANHVECKFRLKHIADQLRELMVQDCEVMQEEAQTVEPTKCAFPAVCPDHCHEFYAAHPAPAPAPAPSGERETLISAMRMYKAAYPDSEHFGKVADLLAADAQDFETYSGIIKSSTARERHTRETLRKVLAGIKAQQVAAPQLSVASVSVSHYKGVKSMENVEFQLHRDLPDGTHLLYIDAPEQKPYGWMIDGTSRVLRGEYAESETKAEAKRCGGTCKAYPVYTQPYDQQALEPCETCGWKAIVPGEPCLMCERNAKMCAPEQEPVAWFEFNSALEAWFLSYGFNPKAKTRPLYTRPQPVAELTDDEIDAVTLLIYGPNGTYPPKNRRHFARAVLAAQRSKA